MPIGAPDYQVNVRLVEQLKALLDWLQWAVLREFDKEFYVTMYVAAGAVESVTVYTVPAGKKLYISDVLVSSNVKGYARVQLAGDYYFRGYISPFTAVPSMYHKVKRLVEGEAVRFTSENMDAVDGYFVYTVLGWEEEAG